MVCIANKASDEKSKGYAFGVGPSDGFVAIRRFTGGHIFVRPFVAREGEKAIRPRGTVNRIRADCVGSRFGARLALYANGRLVGLETVPGGFGSFDGFGIYVYSERGRTTALYDDVVVHELEPIR